MDADARTKLADGDARKCLNALEVGVLTTPRDKKLRDCGTAGETPAATPAESHPADGASAMTFIIMNAQNEMSRRRALGGGVRGDAGICGGR
jgi:hypothetical protein